MFLDIADKNVTDSTKKNPRLFSLILVIQYLFSQKASWEPQFPLEAN